jgi:hypothetical protein
MKTNVYAVMSAIFLSIIIMGGVMIYAPFSPISVNKVQTTDLKTTGSTPMLGIDTSVISSDPNLIVPRDETIYVAENTNPKTLSLSGTGKVTVKANQAIIVLGVFTEAKNADWAVQENALKMTDVVSALKALGIPEADIQTIGYNINPVYNWELRMTVGYQVTNTLQITLNDLSKIGAVIDKSSTAGANTISSVTFTVKDDDFAKYKLDAYAKAVADVKAKAKVISEGFGFELAGILSINESFYYPQYRNTYTAMDMKMAGAEMASTPIISGNLEVSVTLNVVYLLA